MTSWRFHGLLLILLVATSTGCCHDFACGPGFFAPSYGFGGPGLSVFEPNCGIAGACEPDCGIAGACEPDCGIAGCVEPACGIEPDCGIVSYEPDCGIVGPSCGIGRGCGGGCGGACGGGWIGGSGYGCGPFGIWNGWGPDWEAMAAGWNPCMGPLQAVAHAVGGGIGNCFWGFGGGFGCGGGCGSTYWDEWASDPPRCHDPCPDLCASSGYGRCGGGVSGGCESGYCGRTPDRQNAAYAKDFHPWPRKRTLREGSSRQTVAASRVPTRTSPSRGCNCEKCQRQRAVARREVNSGVRPASYHR